jgi:hypothetical protein
MTLSAATRRILDDFVKSPTPALRFISLSLRRTITTPHDTRFARLEFETYYKAVCKSAFYEPIILDATLSPSIPRLFNNNSN